MPSYVTWEKMPTLSLMRPDTNTETWSSVRLSLPFNDPVSVWPSSVLASCDLLVCVRPAITIPATGGIQSPPLVVV